jgi:hypothetical protein
MLTAELRPRVIGGEFEFLAPLTGNGTGADVQGTIARVLSSNGIPAISRNYTHTTALPAGVAVAVEADSSLRPSSPYAGITFFPIEIKTKPLPDIQAWEEIVPKTLAIVSYLTSGRVNASCGHHVHVAFDEYHTQPAALKSLVNLIWRFEPVIYGGLVAASRRTCGYARPLELSDVQSVRDGSFTPSQWDRRHGLNLQNLSDAHSAVLFPPSPRLQRSSSRHRANATPVEFARW